MANKLGPIEIQCDAPPYPIVQACHTIGFRKPEDVRWCRMSQFLNRPYRLHDLFNFQAWNTYFGANKPRDKNCTCGDPLPRLKKYGFTYNTGEQMLYVLAQCPRCRTIFWDMPT